MAGMNRNSFPADLYGSAKPKPKKKKPKPKARPKSTKPATMGTRLKY